MVGSPRLFEPDLPPGLHCRENFITAADEQALLEAIAGVAFSDFEMRGVVARRRVAFFGQSYDSDRTTHPKRDERDRSGPSMTSCCLAAAYGLRPRRL